MGLDARIVFTTTHQLTDKELRDLCYRAYSCFDTDLLMSRDADGAIERHCISAADYVPDELDGAYELQIMQRYYGVGYERGYWPLLDGMIEWLSRQPVVKQVFYGNDCRETLDAATPKLRNELWDHYASVGNLPYLNVKPDNPPCPDCGGATWESGSYGSKAKYSCPGCDNEASWTPAGAAVVEDDE